MFEVFCGEWWGGGTVPNPDTRSNCICIFCNKLVNLVMNKYFVKNEVWVGCPKLRHPTLNNFFFKTNLPVVPPGHGEEHVRLKGHLGLDFNFMSYEIIIFIFRTPCPNMDIYLSREKSKFLQRKNYLAKIVLNC